MANQTSYEAIRLIGMVDKIIVAEQLGTRDQAMEFQGNLSPT